MLRISRPVNRSTNAPLYSLLSHQVGDYGIFHGVSRQWEVSGNIFRKSTVPADQVPLTLPSYSNESVVVHTSGNLQLMPEPPSFMVVDDSRSIYKVVRTVRISDPVAELSPRRDTVLVETSTPRNIGRCLRSTGLITYARIGTIACELTTMSPTGQ